MITRPFLLRIFDAANMRRWNDKICPVELRELDKQAHKMIIAYVLGKFEEVVNEDVNWLDIIEGGIFEFLERLVVTDLKPQIFHKIREDIAKYEQLNNWVYKKMEPLINPVDSAFCKRFKRYLLDPDKNENINRKILSAAHFYATKWEFDIIERANPNGYEIYEIKSDLQRKQEKYYGLEGIKQLALYSKLRNFTDLCGQLRFQIRWSHLHRVPKTSVIGHMLIVAILSYLFSLEIKACANRRINNYFTGLFHDLPEILTRDIIDPVKKSVKGLDSLIKEYEKKEMRLKIYELIPKEWSADMKLFTEDEFRNVVKIDNKIIKLKKTVEIEKKFDRDMYSPRDGEIVAASDYLAAFLEAHLALENGVKSQELEKARNSIRQKYQDRTISGIKFDQIYANF